MKKELLIPVGEKESLKYAINNGADAVYLGLKNFNARDFADNFSNEEIVEAIKLCHLYGVKIYITMNTLIKDNEVDEFLNTVDFLHKNNVDALIVQDFGMISLLRSIYPNLEIHASTQANVSTSNAIKLYKDLGVKRIVLPREMGLDEIKQIDSSIETEVFIHGALCISYSGCCLFSSMIGNRSGNRGQCTGCCRLNYELLEEDKVLDKGYLLSTKELNTSPKIDELLNSPITSFKVEGRMKSPAYVGFITKFYRKLLDREEFNYEEELNKLKILFNRDFTSGHLFDDNILNPASPNHLGLKIGRVVEVNSKKIKVVLTYPIYQEDGLRFKDANKGFVANFLYDKKDNLISSADDYVYLDNKIGLTMVGDMVYKTTSKKIVSNEENITKKNNISMTLTAKLNKKLTLTITDSKNIVTKTAGIVEEAKTSSIKKERLEEQLLKLGNTPYNSSEVDIVADDNIFISIKVLNELRREAVDELTNLRETGSTNYKKEEISFAKLNILNKEEISVLVNTKEQLAILEEFDIDNIYVEEDLYDTKNNKHRLIEKRNINTTIKDNMLLNCYSYPKENNTSSHTFNVTNIYTAYFLHKLGYKKVTLSVELTNEEKINLLNSFQTKFNFIPNLEVICYGKIEVMIIKGNILNIESLKNNYYLKDFKGRMFNVYFDNTNTHIYNYESIGITSEIKNNPLLSKCYFFTDEKASDIENILSTIKNN